jgi:hypothetical protein
MHLLFLALWLYAWLMKASVFFEVGMLAAIQKEVENC